MKWLLLCAVSLACMPAVCAQTIWVDSFDTYANQAEFDAVWQTSGNPVVLVGDRYQSPPFGVYQPPMGAAQSRRAIGVPVPASLLDLQFAFYDEEGVDGTARAYVQAYARTEDGQWEADLEQLVAVGKYASITSSKYMARVAFSSVNWFVLEQGPDRTVGWHTARILGNPGSGTFDFYIDGAYSGSAPIGVPDATFDWVALGSNLTSLHGMTFDDVRVATVPEPAALAVLALGLGGIVCRNRRGCAVGGW